MKARALLAGAAAAALAAVFTLSALGGRTDKPTSAQAAEKMTICHKTGRKTATGTQIRWVKIRVSVKALKAHQAHGDTLVATTGPNAGSCPGAALTTVTSGQQPGTLNENKLEICHKTGHKTGSASNRWVKIEVSMSALAAHAAHGDTMLATGQNAGSCPGTTLVSTVVASQTTQATNSDNGNRGKGKKRGR